MTITIKYEELEYVPHVLKIENERAADVIYNRLKKRSGVRNLRRL